MTVAPGFILCGAVLGDASTHKRWVSKLNSALTSSNEVLMLYRLTQGFLSPSHEDQACPKASCIDEV